MQFFLKCHVNVTFFGDVCFHKKHTRNIHATIFISGGVESGCRFSPMNIQINHNASFVILLLQNTDNNTTINFFPLIQSNNIIINNNN